MAQDSKNTVIIAIIGAVSAIVVALITTLGTIRASNTELKKTSDNIREVGKAADSITNELNDITNKQKSISLPLGTVIASMLDTIEFADEVGDPEEFNPEISKWVLADGRQSIFRSKYGKLLLKKEMQPPNLQGMFLRGVSKGRKVGSYQPDAFKKHNHNLKFHYRSFVGAGGKGKPALDEKTAKPYSTPMQGDNETRPKNIAVYYYIKVN